MSVAAVIRRLIVCSFVFNLLTAFFLRLLLKEKKASAILPSLFSFLLLTLFSPVLETSDIDGGYTCVACDMNYVE